MIASVFRHIVVSAFPYASSLARTVSTLGSDIDTQRRNRFYIYYALVIGYHTTCPLAIALAMVGSDALEV